MNTGKNIRILLTVFGAAAFVILYVAATFLYPGGSQADQNSVGFSWVNNYWCNLLNENAINGQPNPAMPVAVTGMFILCCSLPFFRFIFPKYVNTGKFPGIIIRISGILSMAIGFLLFTGIDHDLIINLASGFGLIAVAGTFAGLYYAKYYRLLAFGLLNLLLIGLNNFAYHKSGKIIYLPVIQKISFTCFLLWICSIDIHLYRRQTQLKVES